MPRSTSTAPRADVSGATLERPADLRRLGRRALVAVALIGSACRDDAIGPHLVRPSADVVAMGETAASAKWTETARAAIARTPTSQQAAFRAMAYLNLAQLVAVEHALTGPGATRASLRGRVAGASAVVLGHFFPADSTRYADAIADERAALGMPDAAGFDAGVAAGRAVGARAVARSRDDRFGTPWTGTVPTGAGVWFSSAVPAAPPALPTLGEMRPFHMTSGRQLRPGPPPAFGSAPFLAALAEVKQLSAARTRQQDSLAKHWAAPNGSLIVGAWSALIADGVARLRLGEHDASRAFALANTAAMDALIACHDAKYAYWLLRPSQADPSITLAVGLPNFPSYPSNHACLSAAIAEVLGAVMPTERARFAGLADEAAESRVHGGIHFRFDSDTGKSIGRRVASLALDADRRGALSALLK